MDDEEKVAALEAELAELRPLKDTSAAALAEFKVKEEAWEAEKKALQDDVNPNWQKTRAQLKALQEAAKGKGVELDADGNPIDKTNVNADDIVRRAQEGAAQSTRQEMLNGRLEELLEEFDTEQAKVVRHYYDKLSSGETVTMQNIKALVAQASGAAGFGAPARPSRSTGVGGRGPRMVDAGAGLDEASAQATAAAMGIKINK